MMGVDLEVSDHTTLSRRSQSLEVALRRSTGSEPIHLIIDSTGLSIVGEGEWAAAKHGRKGRRGWKKLHLGVNGSGAIVSHVLTDGSADDARTGLEVIDGVAGEIQTITGDAAYDSTAVYDAAAHRGAKVIVPPLRTAAVSKRGRRSPSRDRTIRRVKKVGRQRWKKESGYHRQGTVENAFFRFIAPGKAWRKGMMNI
ncbi:MAG: IS5 family transposase [Planctomycetota bacterium]|jgi:IS5 family transposase